MTPKWYHLDMKTVSVYELKRHLSSFIDQSSHGGKDPHHQAPASGGIVDPRRRGTPPCRAEIWPGRASAHFPSADAREILGGPRRGPAAARSLGLITVPAKRYYVDTSSYLCIL